MIHACDNHTVVDVIRLRRSRSPVLQFCLDILMRLELEFGFELTTIYINTLRNKLADDISRLLPSLSEAQLQIHVDKIHPGLVRIRATEFKDFLLDQISDPLLI